MKNKDGTITLYNEKINKSKWGAGPWHDEPDLVLWTDPDTGLDCMCRRDSALGYWCGFVGVREKHPLFDERVHDLLVHGGVTWEGYLNEVEEDETTTIDPPDDIWWVGFNCTNIGDYVPATRIIVEPDSDIISRYKTLSWVQEETAQLAEKIAKYVS